MPNPPITIGTFDNVPAPGSPIRSDWPQEISTFVTAEAAKFASSFPILDMGVFVTAPIAKPNGLSDITTITVNAKTRPTATFIVTTVQLAVDSGTPATAVFDLFRLADSLIATATLPTVTPAAGQYSSVSHMWRYNQTASQAGTYKVRANWSGIGGGANGFQVVSTLFVQVATG